MKINSTSGFRPMEKPNRKPQTEESSKFAQALKDAPAAQERKPSQAARLDLSQSQAAPLSLGLQQSSDQQVVQKVLDAPETARARVEEVRKMIAEGGIQAYFDSVDSEKVASRLLDSGVLDDII